ncbi:hypothetical protein BRAO375_740043 [Bradyrhizobium sp. ORS 375]|nr:hypothetical protein BRAO375_740043 [Bradyrhizobium sp. ORS 375]
MKKITGAPGTIRTSDPQIRSLMLYPAELRARFSLWRAPGLDGRIPEGRSGKCRLASRRASD